MADLERAQDHFNQIALAAFERRNPGTQRRRQRTVDHAACFEPEDVHPESAFQELLVTFHNVRLAAEVSDPGVRRRKEMVVNKPRALVGRVEKIRSEVLGFLQRHVAAGAVLHRLLRVIETARAVAGHAAQQIRVVVILAAQEFLVLVQVRRNADLVAGRAKIRRAHERLQEGFLVELRLRLDQLLVEVLQEAICAVSKRIMDRLVNRVVRVAARAVDVGDGMA